ncbi:uncharacterized protein BKCO1_2400084 [Diplodia corticola]|uniref:Uncharacterized protein n=1 Tax=Diplodia corticola TaxID=236234 RepID=A0A1J9S165_9PEZI|nr:uncharacterized protein BKCO1_2400084 [Diplodia corticola]OJD34327.1 hypothetical protein BKCO1_2400084 [Diplodia corticola]
MFFLQGFLLLAFLASAGSAAPNSYRAEVLRRTAAGTTASSTTTTTASTTSTSNVEVTGTTGTVVADASTLPASYDSAPATVSTETSDTSTGYNSTTMAYGTAATTTLSSWINIWPDPRYAMDPDKAFTAFTLFANNGTNSTSIIADHDVCANLTAANFGKWDNLADAYFFHELEADKAMCFLYT